MFIKKVIVNWPSTGRYSALRILFYDPDGKLFESGSTISSTDKKAETDNFIVTTLDGPYSAGLNPINAVSTEIHKDFNKFDYCYYSHDKVGNTFTIEFKTIQPISKIKVRTKIDSDTILNATLRVIDIKDNEESYNINDASNPVGTIYEYDLKTPIYDINEVGIVETTIDTNTVHFLQFKI